MRFWPHTAWKTAFALASLCITMKEMTSNKEGAVTVLGRTNYRGSGRIFGIRNADRHAHIYIVGKTGTGKSTLLETMLVQDLAAGEGLALLAPMEISSSGSFAACHRAVAMT